MAEQTVRQVIEALTEAPSSQGLDSVIELDVCAGHDHTVERPAAVTGRSL